MSFPGQRLQRCWHLVDATNQTVGRLAVQISSILRGKHKPTYQPNKDMGDYVVIINAEKVHFTANKWNKKIYYWHTGYPGGIKQRTAQDMLQRNPMKILKLAIMGMLKRTQLRNAYIEPRLKIYTGNQHPHQHQLPTKTTKTNNNNNNNKHHNENDDIDDDIDENDDDDSRNTIEPLPTVPTPRRGLFHFGLYPNQSAYAHPASFISSGATGMMKGGRRRRRRRSNKARKGTTTTTTTRK